MPKGSEPFVKPYLKWAGGKRQLLPEIRKHLPNDLAARNYYEPFVGAGAVLFDLQPRGAVINDFNSQLVLTYQVIQRDAGKLIEVLKEHAERNSPEHYYEVRAQDRDAVAFAKLTNEEKAARLIYLNKTCFNGLYRVNAQGLFNVPYGSYVNPAICEESVLKAISKYLHEKGIQILQGDFAAAVQDAPGSAFVYFDPPYHSPDNTNFTGYQAGGFGEEEQKRLRDTFVALAGKGAKCLLSNADTEFIRKLYEGYKIETVQARRTINSNAAGRGDVNEVLIKSWR